jgi:hypothetical protein
MKTLILSIAFAFISFTALAAYQVTISQDADSVKLKADNEHAWYQTVVKADGVKESLIYLRAIQFMASKNFQQNYGYEEEGKLIFTTSQDLNVNPVYVGDDNDIVDPYTVQFALTLDIKNGLYRYTINNAVFFLPTDNGDKRETLYDIYLKATNTDSRRVAKDAKKLIASFESYLNKLTNDLHEGIEQKSPVYSTF